MIMRYATFDYLHADVVDILNWKPCRSPGRASTWPRCSARWQSACSPLPAPDLLRSWTPPGASGIPPTPRQPLSEKLPSREPLRDWGFVVDVDLLRALHTGA